MNTLIKYFIIFLCDYLFIISADMIWIGMVMKSLYQQIPFLARTVSQELNPHIPSALLVWALVVGGNILFALPRASSFTYALLWGALYGFILYGVYDFTNLSLFSYWPIRLTMVDIAWGMVFNSVITGISFWLLRTI